MTTMIERSARPNLFHFATSELSQDAVLAWLATWADPAYAGVDPALHAAGRRFVAGLLQLVGDDAASIDSVRATRQVRGVDVALVINQSIVILIEDKTFTIDHGGQLERYIADETVVRLLETTGDVEVRGIYLKIGNECVRSLPARWTALYRPSLIELMPSDVSGSDILDDYVAHLLDIERQTQAFRQKSTATTGFPVEGLHEWLHGALDDPTAGWRDVANAKGGFKGFWWGFVTVAGTDVGAYLQLHEADTVFIRIHPRERTGKVNTAHRDEVLARVTPALTDAGFVVTKTSFRGGGSSAIARIDNPADGWVKYAPDGQLDESSTIATFRQLGIALGRAVS